MDNPICVVLTDHFLQRLEERYGVAVVRGSPDEQRWRDLLTNPTMPDALVAKVHLQPDGAVHRHVGLRLGNRWAIAVVKNGIALTITPPTLVRRQAKRKMSGRGENIVRRKQNRRTRKKRQEAGAIFDDDG